MTAVTAMNNHKVECKLQPTPPFDFAKSLDFLGEFPPTRPDQRLEGQTLTKAVMIDRETIGFRVVAAGPIEKPVLNCALYSTQPLSEARQASVIDRIRFFLSLDDNLRDFYAIGRDDAGFAAVVERLYGYHQVKFLTPFEITCWAILTQRNPMSQARKMKDALTARYGGKIEIEGHTFTAFPEAAQLLDASESELVEIVDKGRKAEYLLSAARAFAEVDEMWLRAAPYAEVEGWLRGIKGIGEWSANFVLLRGLGRMDKVPVTEERFQEAVRQNYGAKANAQEIAARYGIWQGYWAHYMRIGA